MPVDICGFLEISSLDEGDLTQDGAWQTCIDIGSLFLLTGDECSILFGESKYSSSRPDSLDSPDKWLPIAKRRGVPTNMAYRTTQAVNEALLNDSTIMSTWGFTYVTYDEIKRVDWQAYPSAELRDLAASFSWGLLFQLMQTLDEAGKHQRLIVWFEWC